jgi:hypothetical protein
MEITFKEYKGVDPEARFTAEARLPLNFLKDVADRSVCSFEITVMAPTAQLARYKLHMALSKLKDEIEERLK